MIAKIAALCTVALACAAAPAARASTFTVRSTDDSGTGSLRDAVNGANTDPSPPATIVFAPGVTGVIDLLSPLSLSQSATILGPGASSLELDGNGGQTQILSIPSPATVSISGLRFAFGAAPAKGGAIANSGTLSVSDARFDHNTAGGAGSAAEGQGGAIYNSGSLTVSDSTFAENTAGGAGGSTNCSGCGLGGAIDNATSGAATVTGSTFTGNIAGGDGGSGIDSGDGGGGAIASVPNSTLTVTDSTLTDNTAGGAGGAGGQSGVGSGGAIGVGAGATATLRSDTIDANSVGSASGSAGAGIDNVEATVTIGGVIVAGNTGAPRS